MNDLFRPLLILACLVAPTWAADRNPVVEVLAEGLDQPTAVAVRPAYSFSSVEVFVADAQGVARWDGESGSLDRLLASPAGAVPAGLAFLGPRSLAVAWQLDTNSARLDLYDLVGSNSAVNLTVNRTLGLSDELSPVQSVYCGKRFLYLCGGDASRPTVARARHNSGMLGGFRTLSQLETGGPAQIALSPQGYLVAMTAGRLTFFDPAEAAAGPRLELATGLEPAYAVAYSPNAQPTDRLLYAAARTGVYRLDSALDATGRVACQPKQVAAVSSPAAFAFARTGDLYVASSDQDGSLVCVKGTL